MGLSSDQKKALEELLHKMFEAKLKAFKVKTNLDNLRMLIFIKTAVGLTSPD